MRRRRGRTGRRLLLLAVAAAAALLGAVVEGFAARSSRPPVHGRPGKRQRHRECAAGPLLAAAAAGGVGEGEFEEALRALELYREKYGDLCVQESWKVPEEDPWPPKFRGRWLSRLVYTRDFWLRHISGREERREKLDQMGFIWGRLQPPYNLFIEALSCYKLIKGSLHVPPAFVIPKEGPWPESVWGMHLGVRVAKVRKRNLYIARHPERHHQLADMGFPFGNDAKVRIALEALRYFRKVNGDSEEVNHKFIIPSDDKYPSHLHGYPLGLRLSYIRSYNLYNVKNSPAAMRAFETLGFDCNQQKDIKFDRAIKAVRVYRDLYGGGQVPATYRVPECNPWPKESWGMNLGNYIFRQTVVTGNAFAGRPDRLKQFEELGLVTESRAAAFRDRHGGVTLRDFARGKKLWDEEQSG